MFTLLAHVWKDVSAEVKKPIIYLWSIHIRKAYECNDRKSNGGHKYSTCMRTNRMLRYISARYNKTRHCSIKRFDSVVKKSKMLISAIARSQSNLFVLTFYF